MDSSPPVSQTSPLAAQTPRSLKSDRSSRGLSKIMSGLMAVFAFELIVGGPGYWQIGGVSIRRSLLLAVLLALVALLVVGQYRLKVGHLILASVTGAFMIVWIVLLPGIHHPGQIGDAVQEGLPLAMLFVGILLHAYYLDRPAEWMLFRSRCSRFLVIIAAASIVVWVVGTFVIEETTLVALAAISFFTLGSERLEPALYIQVMPDGFFRVMWITSTLFALALIYALRSRNLLGACLFSLALFVSYTRALWIAATLGVVLAFVLDRQWRLRICRAAPRSRCFRLALCASQALFRTNRQRTATIRSALCLMLGSQLPCSVWEWAVPHRVPLALM
jgi:hypothetical protein